MTKKPTPFERMVKGSTKVTREKFSADFGDIDRDVVAMLASESGKKAYEKARALMVAQSEQNLGDSKVPVFQTLSFGHPDDAPELMQGRIAAVDGTFALPIQQYFLGQALCVAVGSITYRRDLEESLHYWSGRQDIESAVDLDDMLRKTREAMFGMSQTAYLRYFEARHALEIGEDIVVLDGPITYEWLCHFDFAVDLYEELIGRKKVIGVIKDLASTKDAAIMGWALKPGEVLLYKTLAAHLADNRAANKNKESGATAVPDRFMKGLASKLIRGVFKPATKAFGFECHQDHLADMLRILAADAQMNYLGHEIPGLLNRIDEDIRAHYGRGMLKRQISAALARQDEDLFFEAGNERDFRN